jgi:hypothetical protein
VIGGALVGQVRLEAKKKFSPANRKKEEKNAEFSVYRQGQTYFSGTAWSSMRPLIKPARSEADCLMSAASLETVSFWKSSSRTLRDSALSLGMLAVV